MVKESEREAGKKEAKVKHICFGLSFLPLTAVSLLLL